MFAPFSWLVWLALMSHVNQCGSSNKHHNNKDNKQNQDDDDGGGSNSKIAIPSNATSLASSTTVVNESQIQSVFSVQTQSNLDRISESNVPKVPKLANPAPNLGVHTKRPSQHAGYITKKMVRYKMKMKKLIPKRKCLLNKSGNNFAVSTKSVSTKSKSQCAKSKQDWRSTSFKPPPSPSPPKEAPLQPLPSLASEAELPEASQTSSIFSRDFSAFDNKEKSQSLKFSLSKQIDKTLVDGTVSKDIVRDTSSTKSIISKSLLRQLSGSGNVLPKQKEPSLSNKASKKEIFLEKALLPEQEVEQEQTKQELEQQISFNKSEEISPEEDSSTSVDNNSTQFSSSLSQAIPNDMSLSQQSPPSSTNDVDLSLSKIAPKNVFNINYIKLLLAHRQNVSENIEFCENVSLYTTIDKLNKNQTANKPSTEISSIDITVTNSTKPMVLLRKFEPEKCVRHVSIEQSHSTSSRSSNKSNSIVKTSNLFRNNSKSSADSSSSTQQSIMVKLDGEMLYVPRFLHENGYKFLKKIGSGGFASVYKATNSTEFPDKDLACKLFNLRQINKEWVKKHLDTEITIMRKNAHPNVMHAYKAFKTKNHAYIFMPYSPNGTILGYMYHLKRPLDEKLARSWFKALLTGVDYLHKRYIVHRDLKLENFLLDSEYTPIITDFGFSKILKPVTEDKNWFYSSNKSVVLLLAETACGTAEYVAPEVHMLQPGQKYDALAVDAYAMGVCLFEMVNLNKPFMGGPFNIRSPVLVKMQSKSKYNYNKRVTLSTECRRTIEMLLKPDPKTRAKIGDILGNPWISKPQSKPFGLFRSFFNIINNN